MFLDFLQEVFRCFCLFIILSGLINLDTSIKHSGLRYCKSVCLLASLRGMASLRLLFGWGIITLSLSIFKLALWQPSLLLLHLFLKKNLIVEEKMTIMKKTLWIPSLSSNRIQLTQRLLVQTQQRVFFTTKNRRNTVIFQ